MTVTKIQISDSSERHVYRLALVYRKKRSDHAYHLDGCIIDIHSLAQRVTMMEQALGQRLSNHADLAFFMDVGIVYVSSRDNLFPYHHKIIRIETVHLRRGMFRRVTDHDRGIQLGDHFLYQG